MRVQIAMSIGATLLVFGCSDGGSSSVAEDEVDASHVLTQRDASIPRDASIARVTGDAASEVSVASGVLVSAFLDETDDGWLTVVDAKWVLPAGQETHLTARLNVTREAYLHEFSPLSPPGTHHAVLNVLDEQDATGAPEGVFLGTNNAGQQIYGSGVGTKSSALPDGVAMRVHKGQQLVLDLHLFNVNDHAITGTSGVLAKTVPAAQVEHEAEGVLAGPLGLDIPIGHSVQKGQCTLGADSTIFSVGPHMHQLGVHQKAVAHSSIVGDKVLYDGPYAFDSQQRYPVDFVQMKAGDIVEVECTYENDTDQRVSWGQSSLDEMCFIGFTRYPVQAGSNYLCTN